MRFEKEADYEHRLERETRTLTCEKTGERHTFTIPAVYWDSYDALLTFRDTKPSTLIDSAKHWSKTDAEMEDTFVTAVFCKHRSFLNGGRVLDAPLPPKPITYWPSIDRWSSPKSYGQIV